MGGELICDIATVGATAHYAHLALHAGLAGIVSLGGTLFLGLGLRAHRRARREREVAAPDGRPLAGLLHQSTTPPTSPSLGGPTAG